MLHKDKRFTVLELPLSNTDFYLKHTKMGSGSCSFNCIISIYQKIEVVRNLTSYGKDLWV